MRTSLLIVIAAMLATVSCSFPVPAPPAVSDACFNTSVALSIPEISLAESYIIKSGCENLDYDITDTRTQCGKILNTNWRCECDTFFTNTSSWESSVRNISSGQPCYLSYSVELKGNTSTNQPRNLFASRTNYDAIALGGACNTTEIERGLESDLTTILGSLEYSFVNAKSNDITWTFATVTVSATCNSMFAGEKKSTKHLIPASNTGGTTTAPPTTPSGSSSNSNSTSTSSPTTVPPVTPTPTSNLSSSSSSSSSTGGKGTGTSTGNGNGNGASVVVHSATAVMIALICSAVTVIGAA